MLLVLCIFFLSCLYYYPFISDDSLISLRYAKRFIEGKGLTWNDGSPVEGYSNLLWILGVSALGKLGFDLMIATRILGILCSLGILGVILFYFKSQGSKIQYIYYAMLLFVTTPCVAVWAVGGLEQPLYIFFITLMIIEVSVIINKKNFERIYLLSLWLGLLALTRPDGYLFTILTSVFLLVFNFRDRKLFLKIVFSVILIPSLFLLGQLVFRYNYYGELVPNTALVKVKITLHHILRGGYYNFKAFLGTLLLSALGFLCLYYLVFKKKNLFGLYLLLCTMAWMSYITLIGGDIFPAFRHYYVVLIFLVFSIITGLEHSNKIDFSITKTRVFFFILLISSVCIQVFIPANQYAKDERWEFDGMHLGNRLKNIFPNNTLIAVTAAGCIPYFSELPTVDMLGLNDYFLARNPPSNFGNGALAHELGDANYVMRRNPDLIIFGTGSELNFNIGDQLKENMIFKTNYIKVLAKDNVNQYIMFINKYGKNAGIKLKDNQLTIPGYLFENKRDAVILLKGNSIYKEFKSGETYSIEIDNKEISYTKFKDIFSENSLIKTKIIYHEKSTEIHMIAKKDTLIENLLFR